jgi:putative ABC transport system substrate-binding protein
MTALRPVLMIILTLGLLAAPLAAEAQQPGKIYRIGFLSLGSPPTSVTPSSGIEAFRQRLREFGYVEGRNVVIESRWGQGKLETLPALAAELVNLPVDIIVTVATATALAAQKATGTIPIVMATSADPVLGGVVQSLARPGGNVTGLTLMTPDLTSKRLQLLKETVPGLSHVAAVHDPHPPHLILAQWIKENEAAARAFGLKLQVVDVGMDPSKWSEVFTFMAKAGVGGLSVIESPAFVSSRTRLAELAVRHGLPTMFPFREHAEAGGLMSYGPNILDLFRRSATYVDKILKGAKPADLPIEQSTKFELVINLRTAKVLGLTIPPAVLARADEVIE